MMIELIFSDGGAAALGIAKRTGDKSSICHAEICTDHDGNETTREFTPPPYTGPMIDGDFSDIAAIWLMGDVGDISALPDWSSRLKIVREISDIHGLEDDEWLDKEEERAAALVDRLKNAAESGEAVRIWWSDIAHETCGYYWAMSILKDAKGIISNIKIPRLLSARDGYKAVNRTDDLQPQDCYALLPLEKQVDKDERNAIAAHWDTLVRENAPLRAVVNGLPCSVPESFYDYALLRAMPDGEFKVIEAIGRALINGPGGVSDWWYARRILRLIDRGELEVAEGGGKLYYTTLRKAAPVI